MRIDAIKDTARQAHADSGVRRRLFEALHSADTTEARNAAWALTQLPPSDNTLIAARRNDLADIATTTTDTSLRRMVLALLERLEWTPADVRTNLLDFCLDRLSDPAEPCGVRALCVKLAHKQCHHWPELLNELGQTLSAMDADALKPGLRHCVKKTLATIDGHGRTSQATHIGMSF
ncbi:MAG: hypothetical protein IJ760_06660 [Bacteroidales bacterium]|nr:hypothetical protein [Bacteroidales bacterium]